MKRTGRIFGVITATLLFLSAFAGCGAKNSETTINLSVINKGYRTEWIKTLMEEFLNSDAKYSGYTFEVKNSYDDDSMKITVESGIDLCNYDLVFHGGNPTLIKNSYLTDLTSLYEMSFKDGTLKDYMDESVVSSFRSGGGYYAIPWTQSVSGILINYDVVNSALGSGWEQTYKNRTTDEFGEFISALKRANVVPFVITSDKNFYHVLYETWWAQYEGMSGVEDYYYARGYIESEGEVVSDDPRTFLQKGRLESLKVAETIFKDKNNYKTYSDATTMQTNYMEGKSAMIANGDWMQIEQGANYSDVDMRFIKVPVISALGAKLGLSEEKMLEGIDYIDAVLSGVSAERPNGITDDQLEKLTEARKMVYSTVDYSCASIPVYSIKKEIALEFLKWMYSEAGQRSYVSAMKGLTLPVKNNFAEDLTVSMTEFARSAAKMSENAVYVFANRSWKYAKAGLQAFTARNEGVIEYLLTGNSGSEYDTATAIWRYDTEYYSEGNNWRLLETKANQR